MRSHVSYEVVLHADLTLCILAEGVPIVAGLFDTHPGFPFATNTPVVAKYLAPSGRLYRRSLGIVVIIMSVTVPQ